MRGQHHQQLELDFKLGSDDSFAGTRMQKREQQGREVDSLFDEYRYWVKQTLELDSRAHLVVTAVLIS